MSTRHGRSLVLFGCVLVGLMAAGGRAEEAPPTRPIAAKGAIAPAAPVLPADVVAAMQEGRYADARSALAALDAKAKDLQDRAYYALIRGIAARLEGKGDEARAALAGALKGAPAGPWAPKLRSELAAVELAAGRFDAAEALARLEAETLLAGTRKDRLAEVYHAFARRLLAPDDPIARPDPAAAHELLGLARGLAKGEALRARLLFAMARARQAANDPPHAIEEYRAYLKEYPEGADRDAARLHLGDMQLAAGDPIAARLTWTDLARDLEGRAGPEAAGWRARALYWIARTHGIPRPPDDTQLNLGVAALRRFLAASPAHPSAVQAAHLVGESYLARGKSQEALEAFTAFLKGEGFRAETEDARRDQAQLAMTATFQVGRILQGQRKFAEAIAAWEGYLAKFPNGPQGADAQRAILDTRLLIAADHLRRAQYAEARAAWGAFVAQNPLDARVPQVLFQVGESFATEKKPDGAIAAWEPLISKFPGSEPAAHAQFLVAAIYEADKGDPAAAIERFKKIAVEPWRSQALQRVAVMEAKALTVVTPRAFRSGETPHLKIASRNLETLTFAAYRLDAEAYFRKKHALEGVESLDIGLVAPDAEWTVHVPSYAKYKPVETTYDLAKLEVPGVYVVKVTDTKSLQATALVLGSDLDAIVKASREQVLVFAQDMKTGRGRAGARVLVADGDRIILETKTGPDGVALQAWGEPRAGNAALHYLVLDGKDAAGSGLGVPEKVSQGLTPRAYIYTDRPAYRPGQEVALRGVVREVKEGQYANVPNGEYRLEVTDSRGRQIVARGVTLSSFGTFHERLPLDEGAPVGTYRVRLHRPGGSDFAGAFEVQSYQLEKLDLAFDLDKTVYYRGETIKGDVIARYQYGAPVVGRPIAVLLPDGRTLQGTTDATGKYHVEFPTEGFAEEQSLRLIARLPQDNVAAVADVLLAIRAFGIDLTTSRDVYLDGESFLVEAATRDAQGEPTNQELTVAVLKRIEQAGQITEREVARKPLKTDARTGAGSVAVEVTDEQGGSYVIRAAGTDRFGNPIVADHMVTISGAKDETKLRLLIDRQTYKVGEEATANLHSRSRSGTALLTWEADRILTYRLVPLHEGDNAIAWAIDGAQFPNFTLTASRMAGDAFDQARLDIRVERDLRVKVSPTKPIVGPGGEVEVEVTTVDGLGRPVSAEISLALVDRSLLRLFGDTLPAIGPFFYSQTRTGAFATESTNTFKYTPQTTPVAEAVVEEEERLAAQQANAADRAGVIDAAKRQVVEDQPPGQQGQAAGQAMPAATPSLDLPFLQGSARNRRPVTVGRVGEPGMGGMGGGMGGLGGQDKAVTAFQEVNRALMADSDRRSNGLMESKTFENLGRGRMARRKQSGAEPEGPRQRFVETAYWNPSVVTDKDGKARVTFRAPMALSEYRFTARGVTGADTLVGQTTAELTVRKDFFVDLKAPSTLTQGDRPRFMAQVHHAGITGVVDLKLKVYAGGRESVFPRTITLKADGVDEVLFEPFEVPDGDNVRLTLTASMENARDELVAEVPIRPWGVQAFASASGTSSNDATVSIGLPPGRSYENPEMLVVVSPTLRRLLVELAVGRDVYPLSNRLRTCILPPPSDTTADRASDLLAATSTLAYLRTVRAADAPEAGRLTARIQGLVAELVTLQNEDGGWPWVGGAKVEGKVTPSDRLTSARTVWALASAEPLGLLTDVKAVDKAATYLTQEFAKVGGGDHETRAVLLHALSTRKQAGFEQANSLNRLRQGLSDVALAYLALTLLNLDRAPLASEILDLLGPRARTEAAGPGRPVRKYWDGASRSPWNRGAAETTALVALAYAGARPQAPELGAAVEWLLAHRSATGWQPHKAKGPALAALAAFYGRARDAEDRYKLVVTVNGAEVYTTQVVGPAEGKAVLVPARALKPGDRNRVHFHIEGRGTFGYAVTLTGFTRDFAPDQDRANRTAVLGRRIYLPADPELDGKPLPTGFGAAINAPYFENHATQVALGGRARVQIDAHRNVPAAQPEWERDFLVVEEHLPAGTTLIEGSVQSQASSHTLADGVLTFYFAPDQYPGSIRYDVFGYLPGRYRALPARIRGAYDPGRSHTGTAGELRVLAPGEPATDPYKATPDELFARGKAHFDAGHLAEAAAPLEELFGGYALRDEIAREAARMLLTAYIRDYQPRKVVQYFEVLKEKAPERVIPFDELLVVGRAYRDINEFERAYLVWRGVAEASYLEDARVGEVLRQRGRTLEAIAYLLDLWREYPGSASIESDFFGLSQVLARQADQALTNPPLRKELAEAGITRSELLLQSIRLVQVMLAQSPKNPLADEASLALIGAFLELEDFEAVVKLSARFAGLYPKSTFLDSFQYSEALGRFHLGQYDRAIEVADVIARATYKDANGVDRPSPNKWQALYILGQIHDARRQPAKALAYYTQVAERFTDAAGAVRALTRKALKLPEVSVLRPEAREKVAAVPHGLRAIAPTETPKAPKEHEKPSVELAYRNIVEADVKVYPVDLMRLYLTRRNLDAIAGIDLAGITPLHETVLKLGTGEDFRDMSRSIDLPLAKEGAYLVMIRGDSLYASGIVLVTPLELEVLEEPESGRVRVTVRDARTKDLVSKVRVEVIGSENPAFISGETDLRGVFVAEGVRGQVAAVARQGTSRYAFYRGTTHVGAPPQPPATPAPADADAPAGAGESGKAQSLDQNLKSQNLDNQMRQINRLQQRYEQGGQGGAAAGGFK